MRNRATQALIVQSILRECPRSRLHPTFRSRLSALQRHTGYIRNKIDLSIPGSIGLKRKEHQKVHFFEMKIKQFSTVAVMPPEKMTIKKLEKDKD